MEPSEEIEKLAREKEPFPPTDSTLKEPRERATLDDSRLQDREVGSSLSDQEMAGEALFALAEDGRIDLGDGMNGRIAVKVEGGIATITGVISCAGERIAAVELVEGVRGIQMVREALTVSIDRHLDDEDLGERVRSTLDAGGMAAVGSRVSHGIARLVGTVGTLAEEERAISSAAGVQGIRDVLSNIKVRAPQATDDTVLFSLVTQALSLNDLVVLDRDVRVENGVVRISGMVPSLREKRRVRRLAGEIAGVAGLKDGLRVDERAFSHWEMRRKLSSGR